MNHIVKNGINGCGSSMTKTWQLEKLLKWTCTPCYIIHRPSGTAIYLCFVNDLLGLSPISYQAILYNRNQLHRHLVYWILIDNNHMIIYYSNYDYSYCQPLTKRRKWRKAFWSGSQMGADKRNRTLLRTRVVNREKEYVDPQAVIKELRREQCSLQNRKNRPRGFVTT